MVGRQRLAPLVLPGVVVVVVVVVKTLPADLRRSCQKAMCCRAFPVGVPSL